MAKTSKKQSPSTMYDLSRVLDDAAKRDNEQHKELQKLLGQPAFFLPDEDSGKGHGVGYWKGDGGVFSYRRYSNGYATHSRIDYPDSLIDLLVKVRNGETQYRMDATPGAKAPEKKAKTKKVVESAPAAREDIIHTGDLVYKKSQVDSQLYVVVDIRPQIDSVPEDDKLILRRVNNTQKDGLILGRPFQAVRGIYTKLPADKIPAWWKAPEKTGPEICVGDSVTLKGDKTKTLWTVSDIDDCLQDNPDTDDVYLVRRSLVRAKTPGAKDRMKAIEKRALRRDCVLAELTRTV